MNWFLMLAVFFTFMFVLFGIQSINYYIAKLIPNTTVKTHINPYGPFLCALLASIFWALC